MSSSCRRLCSSIIADTFLTYSTVKVVQVPNTFIAIIYRILQLVIFAYIALYIVWYKKGYQQVQEPYGTSIIKVKGITSVVGNDTTALAPVISSSLWDTPEYQLPPLENNAFFIATRQIVTFNQSVENCDAALEDGLVCEESTKETVCPKGQPTLNTFGYYTGDCVVSSENSSIKVCEIRAWCPEELTKSVDYRVNRTEVESFTVYIKTMVAFTLFSLKMRNVRDDTNFTCQYNKDNNPRCPIFRIGDILKSLNTNKDTLLSEGGLIEIRQDWTCNFDYHVKHCYPKIEFNLLQSGDDKPSPGVNYRSAQKYRENGQNYRTLSKIYGLRFVITISGKGGQFNIVNLFVAIGSGIGFMVIASIVCDAIFMYIHKYRLKYREGKFSVCTMKGDPSVPYEDIKKNGHKVFKFNGRLSTADIPLYTDSF